MDRKLKLYDLVEFRFDYYKRVFVKVQTHITNQPRAICIGEKNKILFHSPRSLYTRFVIVPNGILQYNNSFRWKTVKYQI